MYEPIVIPQCRHAWPERNGFVINRPHGLLQYTFLHFLNEVEILLQDQIITAPAGSLVFYDIDTPQWFYSRTPLVHNWMHMTGSVPVALQKNGLQTNTLYLPQNGQFITEISREIEGEVLSRRPFSQEIIAIKFQELLVKIARACSGSAPLSVPPAIKEDLFLGIRKQMFSNLERNWIVAELAALAHLSPSRFYDVYRAIFHISPTADLIHARVDRAKRYLSDTDAPIHDLAEQLGYGNVTHFCRQFKQLTGCTPSQYRDRQKLR